MYLIIYLVFFYNKNLIKKINPFKIVNKIAKFAYSFYNICGRKALTKLLFSNHKP